MFRKYVILSLAFSFALGTAGCTSKKAEGDDADVEASTDDGLEVADASENNSDLNADGEAPPPSNDDLAPGESLPDSAVADGSAPPEVAPGDISEAPPSDAPEMTADAATPTGDPGSPTPDSTPPPDAMASGGGTPEPNSAEAAPVAQASLQKIKDKPYTKGKTLINAVYVARKGDSPEAISQKVFGTNSRTKELCKLNSYNCSRSIKVGDKFYYNSPQRPTDDTSLKVFYEDAGIQPETYVSKGGDNIRKVGKALLGDSRSWMELWATNTVESKGKLDEGTQLKYWPNSDVAVPAQAAATPEQPAPAAQPDPNAPPPMPDMAANEPPPMPDMGAAPPPPPPPSDLPPAPDQAGGGMAAGSVEPPPPPPPPPPPTAADPAATAEAGADPNQTMALGVGAVLLLAAAALFISIRKKRQRRQIDYTATQTQIDG